MTRVQLLLAFAMAMLAGSFLTLMAVSHRVATEWTMRYAIAGFVLAATNLMFEVRDERRKAGGRGQRS